jgi:CYTH domain-containing protein
MPQRRFIIASASARLIRKDNGVVGRVVEGYFPARPDREHFVSIEPGRCYLVLAAAWQDGGDEERTEVPRSQAEALMPLCVGKVGFECTTMRLRGDMEALLKHFVAPGPLDLLSVEFEAEADAEAFVPPAWFGPEVTQDAAYDGGSFARLGIPASEEVPLSNAMLEELLDTLEEGVTAAQLGHVLQKRAANAGPPGGRTDAADREPDPLPHPPVESARGRKQPAEFAPAREGSPALPSSLRPQPAADAAPPEEARRGDRLIFGLPTRRARQ